MTRSLFIELGIDRERLASQLDFIAQELRPQDSPRAGNG
jgi:hypothetical protein